MARSKSIPGSKTTRTSTNKEQTVTSNEINSLDLKPIPKETPPREATQESAAAPRKLEVVKNESRKNLVPINLEGEIRQRAFELYQQRGSRPGSEAEDWSAAEAEIRQRYRQQSA